MRTRTVFGVFILAAGCVCAPAQQAGQPQIKIDGTNRVLTVEGSAQVSVAPELAILHIGFETQVGDAKQVYADGARISNAIVAALKDAGIAASEIQSESQSIDHDWTKPHKFKLTEHWTVRAPAGRAAEILDIAINAGATSSGQIDWALKDRNTLQQKVLEEAMAKVAARAELLAKGMGVHLGRLEYVTNQIDEAPTPVWRARADNALQFRAMAAAPAAPPLAIEPEKISAETSVYAVYAIE